MFSRKTEREQTQLEKRVSKIPTSELSGWADQALFGIGRSLSAFAHAQEMSELIEAEQGAEALKAVLSELVRRHS